MQFGNGQVEYSAPSDNAVSGDVLQAGFSSTVGLQPVEFHGCSEQLCIRS